MSLDRYLQLHNLIMDIEGNSGNIMNQILRLKELVSDVSIVDILEIGFNAGHSSDTFLSSSLAHVTSFDLGQHDYVSISKQYIDKKYPSRHTLILGDSKETIPQFKNEYPDKRFDIIFIDGDHSFDGSLLDITNCKDLAHQNTMVIMDDTIFDPVNHASWTLGPSASWSHSIVNNHIKHISGDFYCPGRGMCWGSYIL
jgi:predicted O-methyltransferase YrrM